MMRGDDKLLADYQWYDWLKIFWNYKMGSPANPPFWFLRDLIVMAICSPIIYFIVQKFRVFGVAILGLCYIFSFWFGVDPGTIPGSVPGFSIVAVFFFTFGAFFSLNNLNFVKIFRKIKLPSTLIFFALIITEHLILPLQIDTSIIHRLVIISGILTVIAWTSIGIEKGKLKVNPFFLSSAFFLYAYHYRFISSIKRLFIKFVEPSNDLSLIVAFFLFAIITILVGLLLFKILKTIFPKFTAIITGGR